MTERIKDFLVPDLGEGLEEATVTGWLVAAGDAVTLNQPLCTLETAKAAVEIPSPHQGVVVEVRGEPGQTVQVGSLLARIDTAGAEPGSAEPAGPTADRPARRAVLVGYGVDEDADRSRRRRDPQLRPAYIRAASPAQTARPLAKPPVRRLARTLGVELAALATGSGPEGIITRADVTRAAAARSGGPRTAASGADSASARVGAAPASERDELVPVRGVRARMAERMAASRTHIPDAHCAVTVDCARLLEVRARLRAAAEAEDAAALTPFALILRLVVAALCRYPLLNSTWVDGGADEGADGGPAIRRHSAVHLGFGAATDRGLLVPVVRNAQRLSTLELAVEVSRLVASARAGSLIPADLTGSTFTVSNFGALGLDDGVPVINYPEAAILGVGSVRLRPVVVDGNLVARPTATLTCAFDHRVADGADAAAFLCEVRDLVETPELALLRSSSRWRAG